jgi:hypothetical protein
MTRKEETLLIICAVLSVAAGKSSIKSTSSVHRGKRVQTFLDLA